MPGETYLVVGLGNIGPEYANTRHNMGFMVLDAWAKASNTFFETGRYGDMARLGLKGRTIYLLKPSTYMNLSGNAVRYWLNKLDLPVSKLMVICDDINLPFGASRMRRNGSDGGHNGLKNINEMLETQDYARIRLGVGHEFTQGGQIDYVLGTLDSGQSEMMPGICEHTIQGVSDWILAGIDRAMNGFNVKNH
ncbi:MAG: aminoacyl-tRNA hydrolase [Bacteroidales bacterium]|nr:aminoacyl-tRNA hydrolase [Bacteroidales bacterium]